METTRELMTPNPVTASPDTPLATCAGRMLEHHIRHLPVVGPEGQATHMLTDVGVFRQGGLTGADLELWVPFHDANGPLLASQFQEKAEVVASPDDALTTTLRRLVASTQDAVLVVEGGKLVGILTEHDGVTLAAEVLESSPLTTDAEASWPVATIDRDAPASQALEQMLTGSIRHLGVTDGEGKLVAVVSMGDLLSDQVPNQPKLKVHDCTRPRKLVSAPDGISLGEAAARMMATKIGCLPLVDDRGQARRILTRTDLIEAAIAGIEERAAFAGDQD